jgi:uncharacterized protein
MNPEPHSLTCPKCRGAMRAYERGGLTIDQCTECRGIFLDRGELDHLIDSEAAFYQDRPTAPASAGYGQRFDDRRYDDRYRGHEHYGHDGRYKKRKSFLSDLFD